MARTADAIIIGGGIIGIALAERLAAEGLRPLLLERGILAREASWAAAGMLAPQSEMDEPGPYLDFCLDSRRLYPALAERIRAETSIDPQLRTEGMFYVAFDEAAEARLLRRAEWQRAAGLRLDVLTRDAVLAREPAVSPGIRMAVHFREDFQLDPRLMSQGLTVAARRKGAELREFSPVQRILTDRDRVVGVEVAGESIHAPITILAAGAWSGLLPGLGINVPTYPVKGQMLLLQSPRPLFNHVLHSPDIYLAPRLDGRVVVGATEEHDAGFDKTVFAGPVTRLLENAFRLAPDLAAAELADTWAGLRPGTPDRRPVLGASGIDGLILATGHFRNGILLAPLTTQLIADLILTGDSSPRLAPFSVHRFARTRVQSSRPSPLSSPTA